jgi:glutamate N-acetyltransferase / amino-acid N-acetyltransferase
MVLRYLRPVHHGPTIRTVRDAVRSTQQHSRAMSTTVPASKEKLVPTSGTYPKGFFVSGTHVGVKPSNVDHPDLALLTSERPCTAAAVFTTNKFQAAPVVISRQTLQERSGQGIRSIVVNAGCANAVTGQGGLDDARSMVAAVDACLPESTQQQSNPSSTLVMSTGVIGQRLPIQKILSGIPSAYASRDSSHDAWLNTARAICTTDTFPKLLSTTFSLPSSPSVTYRLAGLCKGAGMIHPNMATLLGIMCTDAPIPSSAISPILSHAMERSFNSISIDGDTSTNDTVALLANGAASVGINLPSLSSPSSPDYIAFRDTMTSFAQSLSQLVVRDGEGATKFVHVRVRDAASYASAKKVASTIARSPLVKTALFGGDANWGRILCAVGYAEGVDDGAVVPERTSVTFVPKDDSPVLSLLRNGEPETVDEKRAADILKQEDLEIEVQLGTGSEEASYWFCDFSHDYVTSEY